MYCKHCGRQISDDSKYCQYCGGQTDSLISTQTSESTVAEVHATILQNNFFKEKEKAPLETLVVDPNLYNNLGGMLYYYHDPVEGMKPYNGIVRTSNTGQRAEVTIIDGEPKFAVLYHRNNKYATKVEWETWKLEQCFNTWGMKVSNDGFIRDHGKDFKALIQMYLDVKAPGGSVTPFFLMLNGPEW